MDRKILIRHLANSSLAGQGREFETPVVRLGRLPDNDIVFDPHQDLAVSGRHAEVRLENGELVLHDLGSRNGTYVNGARISGSRKIGPTDRICLGDQGPEFVVSLMSEADGGPATIRDLPTATAQPGALSSAAGAIPPIRPFGMRGPAAPPAGSASPPASAAAPGPQPHPVQAGGAQRAGSGAAVPLDALDARVKKSGPPAVPAGDRQGRGVGLNTLMGVVNEATRRERRRLLWLALPGALLAVGLAWLFLPKLPAPPSEWSAVLKPLASSVYVVIIREISDGKPLERGFGTAWSVQKGFLATNSHVASEFNELKAGASIIVRSNSQPPRDLRVVGVTIHPGYKQFDELSDQFKPFDFNSGGFLKLIPAFDVALLKVAPEDEAKQAEAPPLPLADAKTLEELQDGTPLAYIGFPKEGMAGGGTDLHRPAAQSMNGSLSRLSDVFFARAAVPAQAYNLSYNIVSVGGASGSPVFNHDGRVIGLISAGNVIGLGDSGRIGIDGTAYGPRSDLVRELLDGTAEANQKARTAALEEGFLRRFREGVANPRPFAEKYFESMLHDKEIKAERIVVLREDKVRLTRAGKSGAQDAAPFAAPENGTYFVLITARDYPVSLRLQFSIDHSPFQDANPLPGEPYFWRPSEPLVLVRGMEMRLRVHAPDAAPKPETEVSLVWLQAILKK